MSDSKVARRKCPYTANKMSTARSHFEFGKKSGDKSARRTASALKGAPRNALSSLTNGHFWLRAGVPAICDVVSGSLVGPSWTTGVSSVTRHPFRYF